MTVDTQQRPRRRGKLWLAAGVAAFVLAPIVVPPLIGINRYKNRITQLVSAALGRPVRLSGVELRLLPRPGFLLTDLTVEEDPAFGSEPVLHATTVVAAIRFASLWRGRLQISRISVDEASLNLVRAGDGRWNIDSLFRNAAAGTEQRRAVLHLYLEATNSRINIKNGLEKLPYSLLDSDASLWQESDGDWRVRLEGQPARTDVSLDLADTGIVRLDGTLRPAPQFSQMPVRLDGEWRDAQLGQLSRLLLGSDEGWRGDLRGELHLEGTADSAHVQASLQASGVHREEFAPAAPLDFDAACTFVLHYDSRSVEGLECNSPVGDGRVRVTGNIPPAGEPLRFGLDLERIPAQAGLDLLRTVRSDVDASLQAAGTLSGHLAYDPAAASASSAPQARKVSVHIVPPHVSAGPLTGSLTLAGLNITGESLSHSIAVARVSLEPASAVPSEHSALVGSFNLPEGGPTPVTVRARLSLAGFQLALHGPVSIARMREFAQFAGGAAEASLHQLAGEPASVDLELSGPWVPPVGVTLGAAEASPGSSVHSSGAITFREANWKPAFLANAVLIRQATLHLVNGAMNWDPVEFSYGPVKGSATLLQPIACTPPADCAPQFTAHFSALDAAEMQGALLGARQKGTLLSSLLDRFNPSSAPAWPKTDGSVQIDSLTSGPFTATGVTASIKIAGSGVEITSFDASLLGGNLNGTGKLQAGNKPQYTMAGSFTGLKPALVGALLGANWSGGSFAGSGKLQMSGFTGRDLAASATGTVEFDWRKGGMNGPDVPPIMESFDRFGGSADIANGAMSVSQGKVQRGNKSTSVHATVTLTIPHKSTISLPKR
jgi:hypothetical protein